MSTNVHEQFVDLEDDSFAELVARTWRAYGWEVVEPAADDLPEGTGDPAQFVDDATALLVRSTDPRILLAVSGDEQVSAAELLGALGEVAAPTDLMVVAAGGFETGALSVADAYGVEVVGPAALDRLREQTVDVDRPAP